MSQASVSGLSWAVLGLSWALLGCLALSWVVFGVFSTPSWTVSSCLGRSWRSESDFGGQLHVFKQFIVKASDKSKFFEARGADREMQGGRKGVLDSLGLSLAGLGPSWASLEPSWAVLGESWVVLGES